MPVSASFESVNDTPREPAGDQPADSEHTAQFIPSSITASLRTHASERSEVAMRPCVLFQNVSRNCPASKQKPGERTLYAARLVLLLLLLLAAAGSGTGSCGHCFAGHCDKVLMHSCIVGKLRVKCCCEDVPGPDRHRLHAAAGFTAPIGTC